MYIAPSKRTYLVQKMTTFETALYVYSDGINNYTNEVFVVQPLYLKGLGISLAVANLLEILVFDEFYDDVFFWLNLQHFERETQERCWFDISSVHSTDELQLHGFINNELSCVARTVGKEIGKVKKNAIIKIFNIEGCAHVKRK